MLSTYSCSYQTLGAAVQQVLAQATARHLAAQIQSAAEVHRWPVIDKQNQWLSQIPAGKQYASTGSQQGS